MEHAEEADLGAEVPGIASDIEQGCGAGVEQQVINQPLVLQGKNAPAVAMQYLRVTRAATGRLQCARTYHVDLGLLCVPQNSTGQLDGQEAPL
jgi:hypothetical protein